MASNNKPTKAPTAIVVGAGAGGIASAARLARAGFKVTVLEKNSFTGGRCSLIHHEGYRFDQGPSLLLLPDMFHQAFCDLGTSMAAEGIELFKCEPNYNLWYGDGSSMQLSTDMALMKREIEKIEGKDGFERYLDFVKEAHRHYELSVVHVLRKSFDSYFSILRPAFLRHLFSLHPFESIYTRASKYFRTERLRRAFTFGSMYMGMSPFDAPGTYSLLQYTELAEGIWYPRGGFHAVLQALVNVAERLGVDFRLNTSVQQVNWDESTKRAIGVTLESGEKLTADIVLVNADLVYAYNNFFPPQGKQAFPSTNYAESLSKKATSCSSISFYWSLDRKLPQLGTHNIFLADDYRESFDSIFKDHVLPAEPSFYVNVPSRIDPSAAPEGKDALVILVPCGHLMEKLQKPYSAESSSSTTNQHNSSNGHANGTTAPPIDPKRGVPKDPNPPVPSLSSSPSSSNPTQDFETLVSHARETIISVLNKRLALSSPSAYPPAMQTSTYTQPDPLPLNFNLADHIVHESFNDPLSWRQRFNLDRGAILGLAHDFFNVLCFRPAIRHRNLRGCYFVGASTQPGTGVPIVLAGSRVVTGAICRDLGLGVPWEEEDELRARKQGKGKHELDVERWLSYELIQWLVVAIAAVFVAWLGMSLVTRTELGEGFGRNRPWVGDRWLEMVEGWVLTRG